MNDKIKLKNYPCGRVIEITKKYIVEVSKTNYGSIIKSIITAPGFNNKVAYYQVLNSVEEINNLRGI